jgi:tetratricopeptide (TPR) repeat protein
VVSNTSNGNPFNPTFKPGDVIGGEYKYTIHKLVGRGGFGEVYLAHFLEGKWLCALKTIRSDLLPHPASREAFKKEALLWVNLEDHPFIVAARVVHEFSRRLFVNMDYIAPDANRRVSLADHLACTSGPLDPVDSLKWEIQFCYGMEHAFQRGIRCHRDIKPTNILIAPDGNLKISDFGLALAAEMAWKEETGPVATDNGKGGAGLSLLVTGGKRICGTPGYIAPEVLLGGNAGVRSDIYSLGLVLWQMAKGSQVPPFHVPYKSAANIEAYLQRVLEQQIKGRIPYAGGPMQSVIERCLAPEPSQRYESFRELRLELEQALFRRTGRTVELPKDADRISGFWTIKGMSLHELGRHEDAIVCFDKAIELDRHDVSAWNSKGIAHVALGRLEEAMTCYDEALRTDPKCAAAWNNKGNALKKLGRYQEALTFYANALEIDNQSPVIWNNKGKILCELERYEEALGCFDNSVRIDPHNASAWTARAVALNELYRLEEAKTCLAKAAEIDPQCRDDWNRIAAEIDPQCRDDWNRIAAERVDHDVALVTFEPGAAAWADQGMTLFQPGKYDDAVTCFAKALEIDPRYGAAWLNMGDALHNLGRYEEAVRCYNQVLGIDPLSAFAWDSKAIALGFLGRFEEALACCNQTLEIDPSLTGAWGLKGQLLGLLGRYEEAIESSTKGLELNPQDVVCWKNTGMALDDLGRHDEAIDCYTKALEIDPRDHHVWVYKGKALAEVNRFEEAMKCFDKALEIDPDFTAALENRHKVIELARAAPGATHEDISN